MTLLLCRDCAVTPRPRWRARRALCADCGSTHATEHEELDTLDIAHVDCDAFYASVEKRDDPSLADKPLIVGHPGGRGVVTTCCYIARRYGPRSAMPMFKALAAVPARGGDPAQHGQIQGRQPRDPRRARRRLGPHRAAVARRGLSRPDARSSPGPAPAGAIARSRRKRASSARSASPFPSACRTTSSWPSSPPTCRSRAAIQPSAGPRRATFSPACRSAKIHGVGKATAERMTAAGFELISDLQGLSQREMVARFGRFGERLHAFVNGEDLRRVTPDRPTKSVSAENTFRRDTARLDDLLAELRDLSVQVEARLKTLGSRRQHGGAETQDARFPHHDPQHAAQNADATRRPDRHRGRGPAAQGRRRHRLPPDRHRPRRHRRFGCGRPAGSVLIVELNRGIFNATMPRPERREFSRTS